MFKPVYKALVGSRAYGLHNESSDYDYRGFYVPEGRKFLGLVAPAEQVNGAGEDETYWEVGKFFRLMLDNNPNVLEALWADQYQVYDYTGLVEELRQNRKLFLSQRVVKTYGGYATSQLKRGTEYLKNESQQRQGWKHLMHLCRLLISGTFALREGDLKVNVSEYPQLLQIRRGEWPLKKVLEFHAELEMEFDAAKQMTSLPANPDFDLANELLISFRLRSLRL